MNYLVDANVLSEPMKAAPSPHVVSWLMANEADLTVEPIVLSEIRLGIELLPQGARRRRLEDWFARGVAKLACIPIDATTGMEWARLLARLRKTGKTMPLNDSLIAATALVHGLTIVTRNKRDFEPAGVPVLNPFE